MAALDGKVAIVTGASRGIGRAIALALARTGALVVVGYARRRDAAEEVVTAIEAAGGRARAERADMSRIGDVRRLFLHAMDAYGRVDILVNNAGEALFGPLKDVSEADFDRLFAVNVKGVFFAMQESARRMEDGGRIINISSGITILGSSGGGLYGGTKGAVEQFTQAAAKELAPRGITVNTVSPGMTETDLLASAVPAAARRDMAKTVPWGGLVARTTSPKWSPSSLPTRVAGLPARTSAPPAGQRDASKPVPLQPGRAVRWPRSQDRVALGQPEPVRAALVQVQFDWDARRPQSKGQQQAVLSGNARIIRRMHQKSRRRAGRDMELAGKRGRQLFRGIPAQQVFARSPMTVRLLKTDNRVDQNSEVGPR